MPINVTIWNEFRHEKKIEAAKELYPDGIHAFIKNFIECDDIKVTLAALDDEEQGLPDSLLNSTDVLIWWGHMAHGEVSDALVEKVYSRVLGGMGLICLHSAHASKIFKRTLGSTGTLVWGRNQKCLVWNLAPSHPIAEGIPAHFELFEELYSEPFAIPKPDDLIFATWYEDGNLFRGGATFTRGLGKMFYFHPGHETCNSFYNENVQKIIKNAVIWCAPAKVGEGCALTACPKQSEPLV